MATRLLLTGAGRAGKSTAAERLAVDLGRRALIIPELVEALGRGGLPFPLPPDARTHMADYVSLIARWQCELEDFVELALGSRFAAVVCDRGVFDAVAYHPDPPSWLRTARRELHASLDRYDAVFLLRRSEAPDDRHGKQRPYSVDASARHERVLRRFYAQHPAYHEVPAQVRFEDKYAHLRAVIEPFVGGEPPAGARSGRSTASREASMDGAKRWCS